MPETYYYDSSESNRHADASAFHADPDCHHLNGADEVRGAVGLDDSVNYCGTCTYKDQSESETEDESEDDEE